MSGRWPLAGAPAKLPGAPSRLPGAVRLDGKPHRHEGVDLLAPRGAEVVAPVAGHVLGPYGWRGPETVALVLRFGEGRALVLGGLDPGAVVVAPGEEVAAGQALGALGRYPKGSSMLHLELWDEWTGWPRPPWPLDGPRPAGLGDPVAFLAGLGAPAPAEPAPAEPAPAAAPLLLLAGVAAAAAALRG